MRWNENVQAILKELAECNIAGVVEDTSKHLKVRWTFNGIERFYVTSATPSDVRGRLNARADVRRMLRADGAFNQPEKPKLQKALEVPVRLNGTENLAAKVTQLEAEISALIDIVFEMTSKPEEKPEPVAEKRERSRLIDFLSKTEWKTIKQLAVESNKSYENVAATLSYMKRTGKVEHSFLWGQWRLKTQNIEPDQRDI